MSKPNDKSVLLLFHFKMLYFENLPVAQLTNDFAFDVNEFESSIDGYPKFLNFSLTVIASAASTYLKVTILSVIATSTSEMFLMEDRLEVIVFAQPPHFKFCTVIEVFIVLKKGLIVQKYKFYLNGKVS